jgi:predicted GNAT family acetyltransferase
MSSSVQHVPQASRFQLEQAGAVAVLDYALRDGQLHITHTAVPEAVRGQGLAATLTRAALEFAHAEGLKVVPACAYAAGFLHRHPEYAGLRA